MACHTRDVEIPSDVPNELLIKKHADYLHAYESRTEDYEYVMTEYLRLSGVYWGLTAMSLMNELDRMDRLTAVKFVQQCQNEDGGLSPAPGHDSHLLYTLSGVQVLVMLDALDSIRCKDVAQYVMSLLQEDGSFFGDKWGEVDTRFSFCAIATLALLGELEVNLSEKRIRSIVEFVLKCQNADGGFGSREGSESHAGQVFCCLGALSMLGHLHRVDADTLGWWLAERQLSGSGGLNGRPEKLPDVCYSWWVLASLKILGRLQWVDGPKLVKFILACQDPEGGGISDRPGDICDPFHTLFGIAGVSLLEADNRLQSVNPVLCMPEPVVQRLGLKLQILK